MMTSTIQPSLQTAGADTTSRMMERAPSFASAIARVGGGSREKQINEAAQQLVATSLVQPILDSMMKSHFREGPFAPGPVEERFMPLLNRHLSDQIVQGSNFGLVQALTDQLTARTGSLELTA